MTLGENFSTFRILIAPFSPRIKQSQRMILLALSKTLFVVNMLDLTVDEGILRGRGKCDLIVHFI